MSRPRGLTRDRLRALMEEKGQRILPKFREVAIAGVSDPKFLEVLHFVCEYWKDNFRPAFASLCCEAVGGQSEAADGVSLMITLTSSGGGIHDDIIDKSSNKHFRFTVLGKFGLEFALLAGDLLIQKGWALARELVENNLGSEKLKEIIDVYAQWTLDVCEAEFMEIQCRRNLETELEHYHDVLTRSMADTCACARLGAIVGGGSEEEVNALARFGSNLGHIYRLTDDLKDTLNLEFNLSDRLSNESVPLPILYAAKKSERLKLAISQFLGESQNKITDFEDLWRICKETGAFNYVHEIGKRIATESLKELRKLRPSSAKFSLRALIQASFVELDGLARSA